MGGGGSCLESIFLVHCIGNHGFVQYNVATYVLSLNHVCFVWHLCNMPLTRMFVYTVSRVPVRLQLLSFVELTCVCLPAGRVGSGSASGRPIVRLPDDAHSKARRHRSKARWILLWRYRLTHFRAEIRLCERQSVYFVSNGPAVECVFYKLAPHHLNFVLFNMLDTWYNTCSWRGGVGRALETDQRGGFTLYSEVPTKCVGYMHSEVEMHHVCQNSHWYS